MVMKNLATLGWCELCSIMNDSSFCFTFPQEFKFWWAWWKCQVGSSCKEEEVQNLRKEEEEWFNKITKYSLWFLDCNRGDRYGFVHFWNTKLFKFLVISANRDSLWWMPMLCVLGEYLLTLINFYYMLEFGDWYDLMQKHG
jgi:hypothetical protein